MDEVDAAVERGNAVGELGIKVDDIEDEAGSEAAVGK
jgi:hypothetical protein